MGKTYFNINPQLFYLKVDSDVGYYVNGTAVLGFRNFPITIGGMVNQAIESNIPARDFEWSISLTYSLDKQFVIRKPGN